MGSSASARRQPHNIQPIQLPGGWSGSVVTASSSGDASRDRLPSLSQWNDILSDLVAGRSQPDQRTMLKRSSDICVFRVNITAGDASMDVVCKHSVTSSRLKSLIRRLRRSPERKTFENALFLVDVGVNTPRPLALLERRGPRSQSWLITRAVPQAVDLERIASGLIWDLDPHDMLRIKKALVTAMVEQCRIMADHRIFHRDFKASNILVSDWETSPDRPIAWVIDLDGLRRSFNPKQASQWRMIVRLAASLVSCYALTRTDCLRFLRAYLTATSQANADWKSRWRTLARQVADYNRRSRRRKRGKLDGFEDD